MSVVATIVGAALAALALLHASWAFGSVWPARDEIDLIHTVVGEPRKRMPGFALTLAVAACLGAAAAIAILMRWPLALPSKPLALLGFALAAVLIGRGVAGYTPRWRRAHPTEPFGRLDRLAYSPLCLLLGAGVLFLAIARWSAS